MINWDESYSTGDDVIDRQHIMLFNQVNMIEKMLLEGNIDKTSIKTIINFLETYCKQHFYYEEDCMAKRHCPFAAKNKEAHDKFLELVKYFKRQLEREEDVGSLLQEIYTMSSKWLTQHICKIDVHLRDCRK